jgi:hypothetical protein
MNDGVLFLTKWCKPLLLSLVVFVMPIKASIVAIMLFVGADTVSGILRSNKVGIAFTSRRFFSFFKKTIVYQLALICTFYLDSTIVGEFTKLVIDIDLLTTKLVSMAVIFNEVKSINENLKIAYNIDLFDYIKNLFHFSKKVKEGLEEVKQDDKL